MFNTGESLIQYVLICKWGIFKVFHTRGGKFLKVALSQVSRIDMANIWDDGMFYFHFWRLTNCLQLQFYFPLRKLRCILRYMSYFGSQWKWFFPREFKISLQKAALAVGKGFSIWVQSIFQGTICWYLNLASSASHSSNPAFVISWVFTNFVFFSFFFAFWTFAWEGGFRQNC